ncbi:MAG TPA: hypothetical protein VMT71_04680, partial [Syntrophorhabdales bacterium]|nr:hypothetical protein [Syntrophorhabdales bacterium]
SQMIRFRDRHAPLREVKFYTDADITWYSWDGGHANWGPENRSFACLIFGSEDLYMMFHADAADRTFEVPPARKGRRWRVAIDTSKNSPDDAAEPGKEKLLKPQDQCVLAARSMVILISR